MTLAPALMRGYTPRQGLGYFNIGLSPYNARGDGSTDDAPALQAAWNAAALVNGTVVIPPSATKYIIASGIAMKPNVRVVGAGGYNPILRFTGGAAAMFSFVGATNAQGLNISMDNLTLESATTLTGVGLRARNFTNLFLRNINISNFKQGVWTDWGQNVNIRDGNITLCDRGLKVGGNVSTIPTVAAGIGAAAYSDIVQVLGTAFSSNQLDVDDSGSTLAHGNISFRSCSFFESSITPVTGKTTFSHHAARKGVEYKNCWWEAPTSNRVGIRLSNVDYDGNALLPCFGHDIGGGNHFLFTGASGTIGVDVVRSGGGLIATNVFEFAAGNKPIQLLDAVTASAVGPNQYLTYPDVVGYTTPITNAQSIHSIYDPVLGTSVAAGLKLTGVLTAGGSLVTAAQIATAGPLIYSGSGIPTISAAVKGALYLRIDGGATNTRAYIATDTVGGWTALTTAT